jgi:hypothetical protein
MNPNNLFFGRQNNINNPIANSNPSSTNKIPNISRTMTNIPNSKERKTRNSVSIEMNSAMKIEIEKLQKIQNAAIEEQKLNIINEIGTLLFITI